ncbi:beta-lactamase domain-containing protein [Thecamonas trahens ATCC 50062]|uniref:Beta-lactamase domain-containing protein n=1 Tax=Thecamonas trahens ATCC 50062 TaxID=461836 RepID=A0A0L0DV68_THETB|nr:beta-lactamase domain-containing protein [Thecamonas trahens ATCC 50062]KNC55433.1 beta-lactamase domain-containing protein [Thecamonas trahens ATCC 50062]|eukprot:XP_013752970.1 beta-lactamase domain-containing protein [Thecamonas trahens ATCC 50062]
MSATNENKATVIVFHEPDSHTAQYLVIDETTSACAVIDSVLEYNAVSGVTSTTEVDKIIAVINERELRCEWVLDTHAHADHISASRYVQSKVGGTTGIGEHIKTVQSIFKTVFNWGDLIPDGRDFDKLFKEGETFAIGSLEVNVLSTPGHTPACVSYYLPGDAVFVGDTIFMPDMGTARCDFPGGSSEVLWNSVQKLFALPDETRLFTCHDYAPGDRSDYVFESTIGAQKASNKHVALGTDEEQFVNWRAERDATLSLPRLFVPSIQLNVRAGKLPEAEVNGVRYLKMPINLFGSIDEFVARQGKFRIIDNDVLVGPWLSTDDLTYLADKGLVASIVDVAAANEDGHLENEGEAVAAAGLSFAAAPIPPSGPTVADLTAAVAAFDAAPKPVLVHCRSGARAAAVVAAARARAAPDTVDTLMSEYMVVKDVHKQLVRDYLAAQV